MGVLINIFTEVASTNRSKKRVIFFSVRYLELSTSTAVSLLLFPCHDVPAQTTDNGDGDDEAWSFTYVTTITVLFHHLHQLGHRDEPQNNKIFPTKMAWFKFSLFFCCKTFYLI